METKNNQLTKELIQALEINALAVGDIIDTGTFITEVKEITYDPYAEITQYWFYNERGEYKYNVREGLTKVKNAL